MYDLCIILGAIAFCAIPVVFIIALVMSIRKKKAKKWWLIFGVTVILMIFFECMAGVFECEHEYVMVDELAPTCTEDGYFKYHCDLCDRDKTEGIDALEHDMRIESRIEPTENLDGEIVRVCERCGFEEVETVDKLGTYEQEKEETLETESSQEEPSEEVVEIDTSVTYDEIYTAYKENELKADDIYQNNRYRITAKINGMSTGGLLNMTGGATLTMETQVGNTLVFFYAEFEKEQEEALKTIKVGDTITFEGECLSAGSWIECELIME